MLQKVMGKQLYNKCDRNLAGAELEPPEVKDKQKKRHLATTINVSQSA